MIYHVLSMHIMILLCKTCLDHILYIFIMICMNCLWHPMNFLCLYYLYKIRTGYSLPPFLASDMVRYCPYPYFWGFRCTFSPHLIVSFGGNHKVRSFLTKVRLRNRSLLMHHAISRVNRTPPWRYLH
jgi:hypothetical protein